MVETWRMKMGGGFWIIQWRLLSNLFGEL